MRHRFPIPPPWAAARFAIIFVVLAGIPACAPFQPTRPTPTAEPCPGVRQVDPTSPEGAELVRGLLDALPERQSPDLQTLAPYTVSDARSILVADGWALLQLSFKSNLEPGIFLVESRGGDYRYQGHGWFGQAPDEATVQAELARQAPSAPAALFTCLTVAEWFLP